VATMIERVDAALKDQHRRLIWDRGQYHIIDLTKAKAIAPLDIEELGRRMGCIADAESVSHA